VRAQGLGAPATLALLVDGYYEEKSEMLGAGISHCRVWSRQRTIARCLELEMSYFAASADGLNNCCPFT